MNTFKWKLVYNVLLCLFLLTACAPAEVAVSDPMVWQMIDTGVMVAPITDVTVVVDGLIAVQEGAGNTATYVSPDGQSFLMAWQHGKNQVAATFYNEAGQLAQFDKFGTYQTYTSVVKALRAEDWTYAPETVPPAIASFLKFLTSAAKFASSINVSILMVPGVVTGEDIMPQRSAPISQ
jgi:hypothetical protein